jgi:hypothetical protein
VLHALLLAVLRCLGPAAYFMAARTWSTYDARPSRAVTAMATWMVMAMAMSDGDGDQIH